MQPDAPMWLTAACEDPCTSRCKTQPKYIKNNYCRDPVLEAPAGAVELSQPLCNQSRRCCYLQRVNILAHHAAKHNPKYIKNNYRRDAVLEAPAGAVELPQPLCNQSRRCCYLQRVKILAHHAAKHNPNISKTITSEMQFLKRQQVR